MKMKRHPDSGAGKQMWFSRLNTLMVLFGVFSFVLTFKPIISFPQEVALEDNKTAVSASQEPLPQITIYAPVQNQKVGVQELLVRGQVSDDKEVVSLTVGGHVLGVSGSKIPFNHPVVLKKGRNVLYIEAKDNEGNKAEHILTVFCESCETEESQFNVKVNKAVDSVMKKPAPTKQEKHVIIASLPVKGIIVHRADFIRISTSSEQNKLLTTKSVIKRYDAFVKISSQGAAKTGFARNLPRIIVNGMPVMTHTVPVVRNGRTYVAIEKDFVEKLGASVVRDRRNGKQYVYFYSKGKMVRLAAYGQAVSSNGKLVHLDSPLKVKEGKLMLPFRALCEGLGYTVHWDGANRTVSLRSTVVMT